MPIPLAASTRVGSTPLIPTLVFTRMDGMARNNSGMMAALRSPYADQDGKKMVSRPSVGRARSALLSMVRPGSRPVRCVR